MEPDSSVNNFAVYPYSQTLRNSIQLKKESTKVNIESLIISIIDSIVANRFPSLSRPRLLSTCKDVEKVTQNPNLVTKIVFGDRSSRTFTMQVHLMSVVYQMLQLDRTSTMRDLYYENMNFFGNQNRVNSAMNELSLLLNVPREVLCVEASAKGLIAGSISFVNTNGDTMNAAEFRHGMIVPNKLHELQITTDARYILFVEKDAIFQRLLDERIFETLGNILMITGKGYPDIQTRRLMSILSRFHRLKVYALVDCDPYGIEIAAVVKWGSYRSINGFSDDDPNSVWELSVPDLVWLGLLPTEVSSLYLTSNSSAEMSEKDKRKLDSVEQRIRLHSDTAWLQEVRRLRQSGRKTELEALFSSRSFATRVYLRSKLQFLSSGYTFSEFPDFQSNSIIP